MPRYLDSRGVAPPMPGDRVAGRLRLRAGRVVTGATAESDGNAVDRD